MERGCSFLCSLALYWARWVQSTPTLFDFILKLVIMLLSIRILYMFRHYLAVYPDRYRSHITICILCFFGSLFLYINPLNAELNPICHLLALLGAHHIPHISRIRVNATSILRCIIM
jgi:MFS superfamily sulfate permease-like transporter